LENSIDTKNLESGIYVIYISNMQSGEKVIKKLIIN